MSALDLDRLSPAVRPAGKNAGTQSWRDLLFVHWALPLEAVRPLVPPGIELDPWDGRAWVGLVPFQMKRIRPSWLPQAFAMDFLELNARTYVHYRGRPAVWFFSLDASSWLAVRAARTGWSLPYFHAKMATSREGDRIRYDATRYQGGARFAVDYEVGERLGPSAAGTFEHFLLERYLLLSTRKGAILEGQVNHPPYVAHRARIHRIEEGLLAAAGMPAPSRAPDAVHFSPGVDVEVFGPGPVEPA
ncbi:MAG: DUF2071 domain-containing protein [Polyangiaceae bacterium]|nr:DUF2071 domain-containing protein [Polyangiaceae bacterium]